MNCSAISASQISGTDVPKHDNYLDRMRFLERRIEANSASGRISAEEAGTFRESLKGITDGLNAARQTNGGYLTVQDRVQANKDINALARQIRSAAHD